MDISEVLEKARKIEARNFRVAQVIESFPFQCDFIFSAFYTAIFSHSFDSRAVPFPPSFINADGVKRVESLRELLCIIPPLPTTKVILQQSVSYEYLALLDWLFTIIDPSRLELAKISREEAPRLGVPLDHRPKIIYAIRHTAESEKKFNMLKGTKNTFYAFYGTCVENVYSILHNGLDPLFSSLTEPIYGEGMYLTTQISVSLLFSPFTTIWKHGLLKKSKIRVLLLCEIIEDSSKVKRVKQNQTPQGPDICSDIIVKDKRFVRPKYFFIYVQPARPARRNKIFTAENCAGMLYVMFIFFVLLWLYLNRFFFSRILEDIISKGGR